RSYGDWSSDVCSSDLAPQGGHIRPNGCVVDGRRVTRRDKPFGFEGQRGNLMPDDADANVVKVIVDEVGDVPLGFRQCVTFIAKRSEERRVGKDGGCQS